MRKTKIFYLVLSVILVLGILSLRPVTNLSSENCLKADGIARVLANQSSGGDVFFYLDNDTEVVYYINRGVERGVKAQDIDGQYLELKYADHWTLLDPFGKKRHVAELLVNKEVKYTELE